MYRVFHYQTDKLAAGVRSKEAKMLIIASYDAKKQRKRAETAAHQWDRKHFIENIVLQKVFKITTKSRQA